MRTAVSEALADSRTACWRFPGARHVIFKCPVIRLYVQVEFVPVDPNSDETELSCCTTDTMCSSNHGSTMLILPEINRLGLVRDLRTVRAEAGMTQNPEIA